ncbi:hypothetical protein NDU88_004732 [Pleurodeles waltl]|uniref:Uncharacterized protein n=1 Tax=Pleurodeles waltl TaxID=8319 RepID=A0AAV7W8B2_PLEWA|nr:hypothetical protein NDU88_004732 [Pleurodeles waltl]
MLRSIPGLPPPPNTTSVTAYLSRAPQNFHDHRRKGRTTRPRPHSPAPLRSTAAVRPPSIPRARIARWPAELRYNAAILRPGKEVVFAV